MPAKKIGYRKYIKRSEMLKDIKQLYIKDLLSVPKISKQLNLREGTVSRVVREQGLREKRETIVVKQRKKKFRLIVQLMRQGKNYKEISLIVGMADTTISNWEKKYGIQFNNVVKNRLEIRNIVISKMLKEGYSIYRIAKVFDIDKSIIKYFIKRNNLQ